MLGNEVNSYVNSLDHPSEYSEFTELDEDLVNATVSITNISTHELLYPVEILLDVKVTTLINKMGGGYVIIGKFDQHINELNLINIKSIHNGTREKLVIKKLKVSTFDSFIYESYNILAYSLRIPRNTMELDHRVYYEVVIDPNETLMFHKGELVYRDCNDI